jgi:hypothetical protein
MSAQRPSAAPAEYGAGEALAGLMATRLKLDDAVDAGPGGAASAESSGGAPATLHAPVLARKAPSRRVRFSESADAGSADEVPSAAPVVPASVARHAVRRDQSAGAMAALPPPSLLLAGGKPSAPRGRSRLGAAAAANAAGGGHGSAAAGAGAAEAVDAWRPAVILLLDSPLQQFPWESCPGVADQSHIYR